LVAALVVACGETKRSASAYCHAYAAEKHSYLDKYNQRAAAVEQSDDALGSALVAAASGVEAIGDLRVMFDKLERVAPETVEPDVAAVRDSFAQQLDTLKSAGSNPLGALLGSLVSGIATSGSFQRVADWTNEHCGST
jgi:hypothetical protein